MLSRLRASERGSALVPAMVVMVLLVMFAISTAQLVESDQVSSRQEREREASFQLGEGVLNAQIYQLSSRWPSKTSAWYPPSCSGSAAHADCPTAAMVTQSYGQVDYRADTTWVTQVRDNGGPSPSYWSDDLLATQPPYDANDDNFVWVRASATVRGRKRALVALVEAEQVTLNFPRATLVAGHFETSNNGNKVIIDTNGAANQFSPGDVIVRCPVAAPGCADYESGKGQIAPDTVRSAPEQPRAVSAEALDQLRERAKSEGNYFARCAPSLAGDQPGEMVFMEDATGCGYGGNTAYNGAENPGYVVIARGTMGAIGGNATFYGIIYHANLDDVPGALVTLGGNVSVFGSIVIDGPGGLSAGSSKVNLVYDANVFNGFKAFGTAGIVQNTFRELTP
jgi:type II secretory pathway pseudopilin PulG